jgi:Flp pilus assembly protein TadD
VLDPELWRTWWEMNDAGHRDEGLRLVERQFEVRPEDPDLHLLLGLALTSVGREADSLAAVHRAIDLGWDDAAILTQAADRCFWEGDLAMARRCVDRAERIKPRGFVFQKELKEVDRNLSRREKGLARERSLSRSFNAEPRNRRVATDLARHLIRTGRSAAAYHVVARGLLYHPEDRHLRRLERKLHKTVPGEVRTEAKEWAPSGEPTTNTSWRPVGGSGRPGTHLSEAERRQNKP